MDITVEPRGGPTLELDYALSLEAPAGHGECSYHQPSLLLSLALIVPGGFCAGPSASSSAAEILEEAGKVCAAAAAALLLLCCSHFTGLLLHRSICSHRSICKCKSSRNSETTKEGRGGSSWPGSTAEAPCSLGQAPWP